VVEDIPIPLPMRCGTDLRTVSLRRVLPNLGHPFVSRHHPRRRYVVLGLLALTGPQTRALPTNGFRQRALSHVSKTKSFDLSRR
jgi:hypothetical protein